MKRKLLIECYDKDAKPFRRIICGHLDASNHITILSESETQFEDNKVIEYKSREVIPDKIDHFNIFGGMITIYYKSGCFIEISRISS